MRLFLDEDTVHLSGHASKPNAQGLTDEMFILLFHVLQVSWYADRAVIAAIYQAAELYWIADSSPERRDTVHFLRHRLEDAHSLRSSLGKSITRFMNLRDATFTTANTFFRASRSSY